MEHAKTKFLSCLIVTSTESNMHAIIHHTDFLLHLQIMSIVTQILYQTGNLDYQWSSQLFMTIIKMIDNKLAA